MELFREMHQCARRSQINVRMVLHKSQNWLNGFKADTFGNPTVDKFYGRLADVLNGSKALF